MQDPLYEEALNLNRNITIDEVRRAVNRAKVRKAVGIDMIPNEVLKNEQVIGILQKLYQLCLDTSILPECWKKAIIKPIPKSRDNDPRVPLNYRGISLLSCIAKIFTSVINERISAHLELNNWLCEEQNGFRAKRSCTDHIFSLHSIIKQRQTEGLQTFVTFIDFSKAFDCIDRKLLLHTVLHAGIEGKLYFVIKSLYKLTKSCVALSNELSEWFITELGIRQGDNLLPTLFSIFINSLATEIKELNLGTSLGDFKVSILLYADDIVILAERPTDMQTMLNTVNNWCERNKMKINMGKTRIMEFRKKGIEKSLAKFTLGKNIVEKCSFYKYLGVSK